MEEFIFRLVFYSLELRDISFVGEWIFFLEVFIDVI